MSAYIVSPETMQLAVSAMVTFHGRPMSCDQADKLGQDLYRLNFQAIEQRYPDTKESGDYPGPVPTPKPADFRWCLTWYGENTCNNASLIPAFKALQCLIYQCSEGDVPETELYRRMDSVAAQMAARIVSNLPEYAAAEWDVETLPTLQAV